MHPATQTQCAPEPWKAPPSTLPSPGAEDPGRLDISFEAARLEPVVQGEGDLALWREVLQEANPSERGSDMEDGVVTLVTLV